MIQLSSFYRAFGTSSLGIAVALTACNSASGVDEMGGNEENACQIPLLSGSLADLVDTLPLVPKDSGAYVPPSDQERAQFGSALNTLLLGIQNESQEQLSDSKCGFDALGLDLFYFTDTSNGSLFYLIQEPENASPLRGWGLYAVNPAPSHQTIFEAPHTRSDPRTEDLATHLFLHFDAAALLIAGAHRCANSVFSPCDGQTTVCSVSQQSESFRISDAAHSLGIYQTAHESLTTFYPEARVFAIHGFERTTEQNASAYISDGTLLIQPNTALPNQIVAALNMLFPTPAASCNDGSQMPPLCGTTDLAGRFLNGSPNVCQDAAPAASERFIHCELSGGLKNTPEGWAIFANAIDPFL